LQQGYKPLLEGFIILKYKKEVYIMEYKYLKSFCETVKTDGHFNLDDVKILAGELAENLSTDGAYELIAELKRLFGIED